MLSFISPQKNRCTVRMDISEDDENTHGEPTAADQFSLHYNNNLFLCCCSFCSAINLFVSLNFICKWFSRVRKPFLYLSITKHNINPL